MDSNLVPSQNPRTNIDASGRETRSGGLSAAPRRRSRTLGKDTLRAGALDDGSANTAQRRETEQFTTTEKTRSTTGVGAAKATQAQENQEPELPLTPTQRGLTDPVVTTPPTSIHNTPSRRSKRSRGAKAKPSLRVIGRPNLGV
jgi:hypothetical protein